MEQILVYVLGYLRAVRNSLSLSMRTLDRIPAIARHVAKYKHTVYVRGLLNIKSVIAYLVF